jgi:hypothetical protein
MSNTFYRIDGAYKKSAVRIQPLEEYDTLKILDKTSRLNSNSIFKIKEGKKIFDIIQFYDSSNFAISDRVKKVLEENNISGWSCFKIKIDGINENYYVFQNISKAGRILNLDAINNYETENREFDKNTWDGSDIFNLENTLLNIVTPKVKEVLEKAKVTNLEILPL